MAIGQVTQPLHAITLDTSFLAGAHPESIKLLSQMEKPKKKEEHLRDFGGVVIEPKLEPTFDTLLLGGFPPKKMHIVIVLKCDRSWYIQEVYRMMTFITFRKVLIQAHFQTNCLILFWQAVGSLQKAQLLGTYINMHIYLEPISPLFCLQKESFPIKTRDSWVPGIYIYTYIWTFILTNSFLETNCPE